MTPRLLERYQAAVCGGVVGGVKLCTAQHEAACDLSELPGCPRRVAAARARLDELQRAQAARGGAMSMDIPPAVLAAAEAAGPRHPKRVIALLHGQVDRADTLAARALLARSGGWWVEARRFDRLKPNDEQTHRRLEDTPCLVIAHLGDETTQAAREAIAGTVGARIRDMRPTIVTTALDPRQIRARYREAGASLLEHAVPV